MPKPTSIKEAFLPLASRLLQYENKDYLSSSPVPEVETIFETDFDCDNLIKYVILDASLFDDSEARLEALKYEGIVIGIMKNLQPKTTRLVRGNGYDVIKEDVPREEQEKLMNDWKYELYTYLEHLQIVINRPSVQETKQNTLMNEELIKLPTDFSLEDLRKHVKPQFNKTTAAIFLHHLREIGVLPRYTNEDLATLSVPFLSVSDNTTRVALGKVHGSTEADLLEVKGMLKKLIASIDNDLEKFEKNVT